MHVTVDAAHVLNTIRPTRTIGVAVDADPPGKIPFIYAPAQTKQLRSAGLGSLSYRLYTELSVQDWHWNPVGTFSDAARHEGYWVSSASTNDKAIVDSFGYVLPHRGDSHDQGDENGYSRIDDGDPATYWKSNPYLTRGFTHEPDALHPQWVVVDLGSTRLVNAIRIAWVNPFATRYDVQYWTGPDAILDQGHGRWNSFANGHIASARRNTALTKLSQTATRVRFVRVLMSASSNTCDTHDRADPRNCVGYAAQDIALGYLSGGAFHNWVQQGRCVLPSHGRPSCRRLQTSMYVSTVDPWHRATDRVRVDQDQPGLDTIARSPLTHGLPVMYAVPMLYSTPENAVAQIRYLEARGYLISYVELGEEADGQYATPEDYGALYVQWAHAIHEVDPKLRLGGPAFTGVNADIAVWPDAGGDVSWLHQFLRYLKVRASLSDLAFFSFEHYPFPGCDQGVALQNDLLREPSMARSIVKTWRQDGLPRNVPLFITESNFSSETTPVPKQLGGAIWFADWIGTSLEAGVSGFNYYQYEAEPLSRNSECGLWGAYGMFLTDRQFRIRAKAAQYYAAQLIMKRWLRPTDESVGIYRVSIGESQRLPVLTAYAAKRSHHSWSVLIVNKDRIARRIDVRFAQPGAAPQSFFGQVRIARFGPSQYYWSGRSPNELPSPNRGLADSAITAKPGQTYEVPPQSIVVLQGTVVRLSLSKPRRKPAWSLSEHPSELKSASISKCRSASVLKGAKHEAPFTSKPAFAAVMLLCFLLSQRSTTALADDARNRIVVENAHPGNSGWQLPWPGFTLSDDSHLQIKGYPGTESAEPGGIVPLKVTVTPAQPFTVDVFRLGYYHGLGGRLMGRLGPFAGVHQPACGIDKTTLMNVCSWSASVVLHIPPTWISGVYVAVLSNANKFQSLVPFWVVQENCPSDMLYLSSVNTYEAYNNFPYDPPASDPTGLPRTGHSLYDYNSARGVPAVKVSFDRPFSADTGSAGDGGLYDFEPELIAFIERFGYDVTYANEPVIDARPWLLQRHKVVVLGGHAEYQTMANYDALIAARDRGVGLSFISSNEIYWQVRYEPNDAQARRVIVGYKLRAPDPVADRRLRTIRWRGLGRPEQKLIGVQLPANGWMNWGGQPWVPRNTNHWAFSGSGLRAGVPVRAEISGYEIDAYDPAVGKPDGTDYTLLSASPFLNYLNQRIIQNSSIYRSRAGNWVWATGSMDWAWGLSPGGSSAGANNVRPCLQVMTRTILDRMIEDAPQSRAPSRPALGTTPKC